MGTIIALAASKGGVGKSTTAINLARALMELELTVQCVDLDRANRTLLEYPTLWRQARGVEEGETEAPPLPPIVQPAELSAGDLSRFAATVDVVIVDLQAGFQRELAKVAAQATLMIVPARLSPKEWGPGLQTAMDSANFALANGGLPHTRILLNDLDMSKPSTVEALQVIQQQALPAPLLRTVIPHRAGINTAGSMGLTVFDYPATRPLRVLYKQIAREVIDITGIKGAQS